jgi:outer membrane protein assembly factor BamB
MQKKSLPMPLQVIIVLYSAKKRGSSPDPTLADPGVEFRPQPRGVKRNWYRIRYSEFIAGKSMDHLRIIEREFAIYLTKVAGWFLVIVAINASLNSPIEAQNWPAFRGEFGTGHAVGAGLPVDFSESKNAGKTKWKTAIHGKGWSSPVVWGDQIWLTTATEDGKKMSALCVDLASGEIARDQVIHENESPNFCHPTNSYASPTPAIEEGRVYLHFGSYGTTCLDTNSGKTVWQRTDLKCDHFRGPASSPILYKDLLIVAFDGFDQQYVVALNKLTGETVWKRDREIDYGTDNGDLKKAYGTASVFNVDGQSLLICPSAIATIAYKPDTGETVWTVYHDGMNASARPQQTQNGMIVLANGMGKMIAVDPKGSGDITKSNIAWTLSKSAIKKPSPLIIDDKLFMVSDQGIATCVKTNDASIVWQERVGGKFAASPIYDGENIFAFDEDGWVHVLKTGDQFESIAKFQFGDGFRSSPAVAGNKLILRSLSHLYCIESSPSNK